jgi:hypothetical protein
LTYTPAMAKRPPNVDRETWLRERAETWRRRNRVITVLMAVAIAVVLFRYFFLR